jgi:hypothetical protein
VKKRKRANNTTLIKGSNTFAPSPLMSGGSTTNTPTASTFNTLIGVNSTTPAAPIAYASTSTNIQINDKTTAGTSAIATAPIAPSTATPTPNSAVQDVEMADAAPALTKQAERSNRTEQAATQGFADIDMNYDARPQRPAADVDAAEMLLGLRKPS